MSNPLEPREETPEERRERHDFYDQIEGHRKAQRSDQRKGDIAAPLLGRPRFTRLMKGDGE